MSTLEAKFKRVKSLYTRLGRQLQDLEEEMHGILNEMANLKVEKEIESMSVSEYSDQKQQSVTYEENWGSDTFIQSKCLTEGMDWSNDLTEPEFHLQLGQTKNKWANLRYCSDCRGSHSGNLLSYHKTNGPF